MSRKKRIKKGLDSVREQIELHKKKLEKAMQEEDIGLADYYKKEIFHLEQEVERRKNLLLPKKKRKTKGGVIHD
jgi:hypothetical protein